jgi:hypothetical protein
VIDSADVSAPRSQRNMSGMCQHQPVTNSPNAPRMWKVLLVVTEIAVIAIAFDTVDQRLETRAWTLPFFMAIAVLIAVFGRRGVIHPERRTAEVRRIGMLLLLAFFVSSLLR